MPKVIRKDVDYSQGHCYEPRPAVEGSPNVFVNNIPVVRVTDNYYPSHTCGDSTHPMGPAVEGSPNVFANNLAVHRNGDDIQCGDMGSNGSPNVFASS